VFIEGPISVMGGSSTGIGGIISVEAGAPDAAGRIAINAPLDARGFGDGGEIGLAASGAVDVRSNVLASSSAGKGGLVQIDSQGDVLVGATVSVDGTVEPGEGELAGRIELLGCTVTVCAVDSPACPGSGNGLLSSLGPRGLNRLTGRDLTAVLGTVRANATTGRNEIIYDGSEEREPLLIGPVTPAPQLLEEPSLMPCPNCGNRSIEPPETCDDGNMLDGDGCSSSCQIEESIPGDANNDFELTPDDLGFIITEIFDGDGDTIGMVSGGAFAGGPGADANGDEHVTAADLTATARLLAP
jgi:cysteine-rich repeat protein